MRITLVHLLTFSVSLTATIESQDGGLGSSLPCDEEKCLLPYCFCSGTKIPRNLSTEEVPQMVMLTFDDYVNSINWGFYKKLFINGPEPKKNTNGCNITGTFFVSHKSTDYLKVETLWQLGHEIADHSVSHREPRSWWTNATVSEWRNEINGQRRNLRERSHMKMEEIKGFRAPFLRTGGNKQFKVLKDLGFLYDSSLSTSNINLWPYTLDYRSVQECKSGHSCPKGKN